MANQILTTREERGEAIAESKEPQVTRVEENFYTVKSQNGNCKYAVSKFNNKILFMTEKHEQIELLE